jgi:hypothetical protein
MKRFGCYVLTEKRRDLMYIRMPGAPARTVDGLINPTRRELEAAISKYDELRFIISPGGDFYAWNASSALHAQVAAGELGLKLDRGGMAIADGDDFGQGTVSYGARNPVSVFFTNDVMTKGNNRKWLNKSRTLKALAKDDQVKIFY